MRPRTLSWRFLPFYLFLLVSLLALSWNVHSSFREFYVQEKTNDLKARVKSLDPLIRLYLTPEKHPDLPALAQKLADEAGARITVILPDGQVLADSLELNRELDNHGNRPEVLQALTQGWGVSQRLSATMHKEILYVASPIREEGELLAVLRVSLPLREILTSQDGLRHQIFLAALLIALLAGVASWLLSRNITKPLQDLQKGAEAFARGELGTKLLVHDTFEVGSLATSMNRMAQQIKDRIEIISQEKREKEAIFFHISDALLVLNPELLVKNLNPAAENLFQTSLSQAKNRKLLELCRQQDLHQMAKNCLSRGAVQEKELLMFDGKKEVQVHATLLNDGLGGTMGVLLVLRDLSHLKRLENIRKSFVSNVSHELKTPVTNIKGFVETLLDGAKDDPETCERFLKIAAKHADLLSKIIDDLLDLARLEESNSSREFPLSQAELSPLVQGALSICQPQAQAKGISLTPQLQFVGPAWVNAPLLEQVLVNLIDNAIKYCPDGSQVQVITQAHPEHGVLIEVADNGPGIAKEHQDRIFERFYRVEKSRSRHLGGTGLGLSIVKNILLLHGGEVKLISQPGQGCRFVLHLPNQPLQ